MPQATSSSLRETLQHMMKLLRLQRHAALPIWINQVVKRCEFVVEVHGLDRKVVDPAQHSKAELDPWKKPWPLAKAHRFCLFTWLDTGLRHRRGLMFRSREFAPVSESQPNAAAEFGVKACLKQVANQVFSAANAWYTSI